jgi:hypothetical protein
VRVLEFHIIVESGKGCCCTKKSVELRGVQVLEASRGVFVPFDPLQDLPKINLWDPFDVGLIDHLFFTGNDLKSK